MLYPLCYLSGPNVLLENFILFLNWIRYHIKINNIFWISQTWAKDWIFSNKSCVISKHLLGEKYTFINTCLKTNQIQLSFCIREVTLSNIFSFFMTCLSKWDSSLFPSPRIIFWCWSMMKLWDLETWKAIRWFHDKLHVVFTLLNNFG